MVYTQDKYKSPVYIKKDLNNFITNCEGGYSISMIDNIDNWVKIDEGLGEKYNLCQTHYFDKSLINFDGTHNYIYDQGIVRETTNEEREKELSKKNGSEE